LSGNILKDDTRAVDFIRPLRDEKSKTHCVRDIQLRVVILYEAVAAAQNGDPCLATIYSYSSTNNAPTNTKEKASVWSSAWDFDVLVNGESGYIDV
jgi:hypothetical protein